MSLTAWNTPEKLFMQFSIIFYKMFKIHTRQFQQFGI